MPQFMPVCVTTCVRASHEFSWFDFCCFYSFGFFPNFFSKERRHEVWKIVWWERPWRNERGDTMTGVYFGKNIFNKKNEEIVKWTHIKI